MLASVLVASGLFGPVMITPQHDLSDRVAVVWHAFHDAAAWRTRCQTTLVVARLAATEWPAAAEAVYDAALHADPLSAEAYAGRGAARARLGRPDGLSDLDHAVRLAPDDAGAWEARGVAKGDAGDPSGAASDFEAALRLAPRPRAIMGLTRARLERNDHAGVESAVAVGLVVVGDEAARAELLGLRSESRGRRGDWAGVLADAGRAAWLCPGDPRPLIARGDALARLGRPLEAVEDYREALDLAPDCALAAHRLAWLLATCPDAQVRDGGAAVRLARRLAEPVALAAALAESGDFTAAASGVRELLRDAPEPVAANLRRQLACYEQQTPWRE